MDLAAESLEFGLVLSVLQWSIRSLHLSHARDAVPRGTQERRQKLCIDVM